MEPKTRLIGAETAAAKNLDYAIDRVETEKRLKAKDAKFQSKLAFLAVLA